jgi:hypothetical protein
MSLIRQTFGRDGHVGRTDAQTTLVLSRQRNTKQLFYSGPKFFLLDRH